MALDYVVGLGQQLDMGLSLGTRYGDGNHTYTDTVADSLGTGILCSSPF